MLCDGREWVLFDAVGTLIYPEPAVADVYHAVAARHGSRLTVQQLAERFPAALSSELRTHVESSQSLEQARWQRIVARVVSDVPGREAAVFQELWDHFAQARHWRLFDDVPATLSALRETNIKLAVASNFDSRLRRILAEHPQLANLDEVFVSSELGCAKPDPRFFRRIEQRLGVASAAITLIGDDEVNDYQAARAAGWQAIWLRRARPTDRCSDAISSLRDLVEHTARA